MKNHYEIKDCRVYEYCYDRVYGDVTGKCDDELLKIMTGEKWNNKAVFEAMKY